ncbi:MAG: mutator mutT protein [Oscillospiraceae bacterium]|nr:mutator mutT protein [Oscillospiraceae bacterium]
MKNKIRQVAVAIIKKDGKILICKRSRHSKNPLLWEFPGGKLEQGETLEQCAIRETLEEVGLNITINSAFAKTSYKYDDGPIDFTFFDASVVSGEIVKNVHEEVKWIDISEISDYTFCLANKEILARLRYDMKITF